MGGGGGKGQAAAVGTDDLPDDPQAQPVVAAARVGRLGADHRPAPVEGAQPVGRDPRAVVGHREQAPARRGAHHHLDGAAAGVVVHAVVQQVCQHPAQKGRVPGHRQPGPGRRFGEGQGVGVGQSVVQHLADRLPGQLHRVQLPHLQGAEGVFQLGGQVQVGHKAGQFFALTADDGRLRPGGVGQGGVLLQLAGVAQNDRQRGADVVGDAPDPVGPGVVLLGDVGRGAVEPGADLGQLAVLPQVERLAADHAVDPVQDGAHRLFHPAGAVQKQHHDQKKVGVKHHAEQHTEKAEIAFVHRHIVFDHRVFGLAHRHQAAVVLGPDRHGPVFEIPAAEHGHRPHAVVAGEGVGHPVFPDNVALRVQHHGPGVGVQHGGGLGVGLPAVGALAQVAAEGGDGKALPRRGHLADEQQAGDQQDVGRQQQGEQPHRRKDVPPEKPPDRVHRAAPLSLGRSSR